MKDRKARKSRSKEKVVGFSLASLFNARNGSQSPRVETTGVDHSTRITQVAGAVKTWEDRLDHGRIPDTST